MGKTKTINMHGLSEIGRNVPGFLVKLWKLVNDPDTDELICWNESCTGFIITTQAQFTRDLLPLYFKHNNMASFIRQLNMYGFHKITSIESGGLRSYKDDVEFGHPYFIKDHPYLLENIKRKITIPKPSIIGVPAIEDPRTSPKAGTQNEILARVLSEVNNLKGKQESWDTRLSAMKRENETLWRELAVFRQKHLKQEQIINKLIHFIVTMVQPSRNVTPLRRRYPLMLSGAQPLQKVGKVDTGERSPSGPTIHEIDPSEVLHSVPSTSSSVAPDFVVTDHDGGSLSEFIQIGSPKSVASSSSVVASGVAMPSPSTEEWLDLEVAAAEEVADEETTLITNPLTPINPADVNPAAAAASLRDFELCYNSPLVASAGRSANAAPMVLMARKKARKSGVPAKRLNSKNRISVTEVPDTVTDSNNCSTSDLLLDLVGADGAITQTQMPSLDSLVAEEHEEEEDVKLKDTRGKALLGRGSIGSIGAIPMPATAAKESDSTAAGSMAVVRQNSLSDGLARYPGTHDLQDHVESVQGDLDYLKEILKGDNYSLDANALLGLFSDDPLAYEMPPVSSSEDPRDKENGTGNELMTYQSPNLMDLMDLYNTSGNNEWFNVTSPQSPLSPLAELATPQVLSPASSTPPVFPSPSKRRKK